MTDLHHQLVELKLNGHDHTIAVEPRRTLIDVLREDLLLTGAKPACNMGNCGACTVLVDDDAVYSCLVLAAECSGRAVTTVEGLANGAELDPLQKCFVECDALQCGFCTPGQLMSLVALRRAGGEAPTKSDIVEAVSGNLCRCGAYNHILDAAVKAFGATA